ncbi:hypothetical protein [Streptomyces sp. NPDC047315]|uniref:hypothetical protein n=1 Tax=Streptomyces sp. NPDC047315 TaxID=3155142 RepID=UPI0033D91E44
MNVALTIIPCSTPPELYRRLDGQSSAQAPYIELDLRRGLLLADVDVEIGNAFPPSVRDGFDRRYAIPVLTGEAANRVMEEIAPLAVRVLADWEKVWDGNGMVARLGRSALAAESEIRERLGLGRGDRGFENQGFDEEDLVGEWRVDGAVNGGEVEEYGITAETSDERLDDIERRILTDLAECDDNPVAVCHGLSEYLRSLRADLAEVSDVCEWAPAAGSTRT